MAASRLTTPFEDEDTVPARVMLPLHAVPRLRVSLDELRQLPLDASAALLLSRVDGRCSVYEVLQACDMSGDDALLTMSRLVEVGAIELA